jgi:hypothetical protein
VTDAEEGLPKGIGAPALREALAERGLGLG